MRSVNKQRRVNFSTLICILFPFFHSPIFSYCSLLLLPSCSLSLFVAITITAVETLRGHPRDMKKVSVSEAGRLQEQFSVWELAQLQINIENSIACVASVSSRVIARKLEWGAKKMEGGGGGEKRKCLPANPTILENAP